MIPIPTIVFNQITFPLQLLASGLSAEGLSWLGVPVLREGNVIILPGHAGANGRESHIGQHGVGRNRGCIIGGIDEPSVGRHRLPA